VRLDRLPPEVLATLEREVLDDPRATAEQARRWLADRGFHFGLGPIVHHRTRRARRTEQERHDAAVEKRLAELAAAEGLTEHDLARGAALRHEHELFQRLRHVYDGVAFDALPVPVREVALLARALRVQTEARGITAANAPERNRRKPRRAGRGVAARSPSPPGRGLA
jgi:hypothetical protein